MSQGEMKDFLHWKGEIDSNELEWSQRKNRSAFSITKQIHTSFVESDMTSLQYIFSFVAQTEQSLFAMKCVWTKKSIRWKQKNYDEKYNSPGRNIFFGMIWEIVACGAIISLVLLLSTSSFFSLRCIHWTSSNRFFYEINQHSDIITFAFLSYRMSFWIVCYFNLLFVLYVLHLCFRYARCSYWNWLYTKMPFSSSLSRFNPYRLAIHPGSDYNQLFMSMWKLRKRWWRWPRRSLIFYFSIRSW